jgi:hypothetical protein
MEIVKSINLLVRFLVELCALAALGYWGFHSGKGIFLKLLCGIGAPLLAAIIWGTFIAPRASVEVPDWLHLLLEIVVLGSAALALYFAKQPTLCFIYTAVVIINRIFLTVWDQ